MWKEVLYAAGVRSKEQMKNSPHVGIVSVWWEGNLCKYAHPLFGRGRGLMFVRL